VFDWGHGGAGLNLPYQALAHAVSGAVAPATDGRFIDEPSSFYESQNRRSRAFAAVGCRWAR
jgi:hypothetical protein